MTRITNDYPTTEEIEVTGETTSAVAYILVLPKNKTVRVPDAIPLIDLFKLRCKKEGNLKLEAGYVKLEYDKKRLFYNKKDDR